MTTTLEQLRMLVDDPETADDPVFENAHYNTILEIESNIYRAAATAAKILAAHYAGKVKVTAGPVEIENQQKFEHYESLADSYDQRAREGGGSGAGLGVGAPAVTGILLSEIETAREDSDRVDSVFYQGMDKNPSNETDNSL